MRERHRCLVAAVAVAVAATFVGAQAAWASLTDASAAAGAFSTDVLASPTALALGAGGCSLGSGDRTVLTWTATTSVWATGYEVARSTSASGPFTVIATVSGAGTTTYTDGPLPFSTTYHYEVRSVRNAWRSVDATGSRKTRSSLCI